LPENVPACLWQTKIEWQGNAADVEITNGRGAPAKRHISVSSPADATEQLLRGLWEGDEKAVDSAAEIDMVGHRVVHGGPRFKDPVLITAEVKAAIAGASAFAPLQFSIPGSTKICHSLRWSTQDRMNGLTRESGATDFTVSIINIAPGAQRNFWAEIRMHCVW
jgi:acetate kinase